MDWLHDLCVLFRGGREASLHPLLPFQLPVCLLWNPCFSDRMNATPHLSFIVLCGHAVLLCSRCRIAPSVFRCMFFCLWDVWTLRLFFLSIFSVWERMSCLCVCLFYINFYYYFILKTVLNLIHIALTKVQINSSATPDTLNATSFDSDVCIRANCNYYGRIFISKSAAHMK